MTESMTDSMTPPIEARTHTSAPQTQRPAESDRLTLLLLRTARTVETRLESALVRHGLSMAKIGVLRALAAADEPLPLTRLAERICCVKSNVTQLVDRLETELLVTRIDDPADRRCVRAAITDAGRHEFELGSATIDAEEQELADTLGRADYDRLHDALVALREKA